MLDYSLSSPLTFFLGQEIVYSSEVSDICREISIKQRYNSVWLIVSNKKNDTVLIQTSQKERDLVKQLNHIN